MSSISLDKELQERLREASAIGDIDEVRILVASGVNINSQNEINGWTCLHWACKRNHKHIVSYLLSCGADIEILTAKDELASQLTSKPEIKRLLGVEVEEVPEVKEPELPIIPNYLSNPPFMYSKLDNKSEVITDQHATQNGTRGCEEDSEPASLPPTLEAQDPHSMLSDPPAALPNPSPHRTPHASDLLPVAEQNGASPSSSSSHNHAVVNCTVPMDLSVEPHLINHADYQHVAPARNGAMCSPPLSSASSGGGAVQPPVAGAHPTMSRQQSYSAAAGPQPVWRSRAGVPAFLLHQHLPGQCPSARENDFIEVELDRQELTYRSLLRVCCRELGISAEHDKDVARLQDFQELEVVLEKAEGLSFFSGGGLTDRPCYNMKASRLTY
ncbi:hypothetical protein fugu_015437 [Takifugu bimaculatus]|uniref:Uncharacterized protein n=1 Tax=Takifugu bimaculatus TaxID=433685 RepID=A0A4Z2BYN9_9TELE|nr:hypothetical protein fugu_015437 [Takifugu bimaculatus]